LLVVLRSACLVLVELVQRRFEPRASSGVDVIDSTGADDAVRGSTDWRACAV
jgi:hypothetical protein